MQKREVIDYKDALEASKSYFGGSELEASVFLKKYALQDLDGNIYEKTPDEMHKRLAKEFTRIEQNYPNPRSYEEIYESLKDFKYLIPQGSPMAGIGNSFQYMSLSNCYVTGNNSDSYPGIMKMDEQLVNLMKRRAGVGVDLSHLRPENTIVNNAARSSTGAASFMERFSNSTREVAQCLGGDTLVLCETGLKPIKEVTTADKVWTENGWVKVVNVLQNEKDTIKITTKYGKNIVCSKDHVIHTLNGEKKAGDLAPGDILTQIVGEGWTGETPRLKIEDYEARGNRLHSHVKLPTEVSTDLAYFLGFSFGNGCIRKDKFGEGQAFELSTHEDNKDIIEKLIKIIKTEFNYDAKINDPEDDKVYKITIHSKELIFHLKHNGFLKKKADKIELPSIFLSAKKDVVGSFISGFFDADGCAQEGKKTYKMSSISHNFMLTLQSVLQAFGIVSNIHTETDRGENWSDLHTLTINGGHNQKLFRILCEGSMKLKSIKPFVKKRDFLRSNYQIKDFGSKASRHPYVINNDQYITYTTAQKLKEDLNLDKKIRLLQDPVESIESYKNNQDVYDLSLEDTHWFSANGLYVHNSGRRGALMITLSSLHPDIEKFINIKMDETKVTGANISLKMMDELMEAIDRGDSEFTLRFPTDAPPEKAKITKKINPKEFWNTLIHNAWARAEPGCLFWDAIIRESLPDCYADLGFETKATNPCGEVPLCLNDSCRLLVANLFSFVKNPFTDNAYFDFKLFEEQVILGQRLMDDLVDLEIEKVKAIIRKIENDPEPTNIKKDEIEMWQYILEMAKNGRRTGFGITAMGDMLAGMGLKYGTDEATKFAEHVMRVKKHAEYKSSNILAQERGAFPIWEPHREKDNPFLLRIKEENPELYSSLMTTGRRNIALSTIAPTGTVSMLAKTSSGIENVFSIVYFRSRKINPGDGDDVRVDFVDKVGDSWQEYPVFHPTFLIYLNANGISKEEATAMGKEELDEWVKKSPYYGATANDTNWVNKVKMQGKVQKHVDHSISVTTNLPENISEETVKQVYMEAWKSGCKGVTIYRDGSRSGVLNTKSKKEEETGIIHTDAPKRPKKLEGDLYHVTAVKERWTVLVGLLEEDPYEVFAVPGEIGKHRESYTIVKVKSGHYNIEKDDEVVYENFTQKNTEEEASLTRLISTALRHGSKIDYVVEQLNKSEGSIISFGKAIARTLKRYLTDIERAKKSNPLDCPNDGKDCNVVYSEGCLTCHTCGTSKCT